MHILNTYSIYYQYMFKTSWICIQYMNIIFPLISILKKFCVAVFYKLMVTERAKERFLGQCRNSKILTRVKLYLGLADPKNIK